MGGDAGYFFRRPGREDARRERARARVDRENVAKMAPPRETRGTDVVHFFIEFFTIRVLRMY